MTSATKTADAPAADKAPRRARTTRSAVATTKATKRPGATETAVAVRTQEAPTVPAPKREIADDKVRKSIAVRLLRAKEAGWSRPQLAELAFGSADQHYPIWRFQDAGRGGYVEHVDAIEHALSKIETGEAKLPERAPRAITAGPSKAQLATDCAHLRSTIESVRSLLDTVVQRPKVTAAEKKLATSVLDLLGTGDAKDES